MKDYDFTMQFRQIFDGLIISNATVDNGIASKGPKNAFASFSIQKRRVYGIDDIAVFPVRNASSLSS